MDSFSLEECRHVEALERVRYFSGQLLGAADFQDEQQYLRDRARLHNRMLHGWGVVSGLDVSPASSGDAHGVVISAGLALDPCGREIIVPESVSLVPLPVAQPAPLGSTVTISICYAEQPVGGVPEPASPSTDDSAVASRIRETFEVRVSPSAARPAGNASAPPADAYVALADVTVEADGTLTVDSEVPAATCPRSTRSSTGSPSCGVAEPPAHGGHPIAVPLPGFCRREEDGHA